MDKHVLFIQGGGDQEDYEADAKLVNSLREALGETYTVHYPLLSNENSADFGKEKADRQRNFLDPWRTYIGGTFTRRFNALEIPFRK